MSDAAVWMAFPWFPSEDPSASAVPPPAPVPTDRALVLHPRQ